MYIKFWVKKRLFPLVLVWVRHEEFGNYTHLITLSRNYSTFKNFEVIGFMYCLLVVSTLNMFSTVSSFGQQATLTLCTLPSQQQVQVCHCLPHWQSMTSPFTNPIIGTPHLNVFFGDLVVAAWGSVGLHMWSFSSCKSVSGPHQISHHTSLLVASSTG